MTNIPDSPADMPPLYTERVLTAACTAAGRAVYEQNVKASEEEGAPPWDDLPLEIQRAFIDAAIPIAWAALNALPDGRWAIWEQGYGSDLDNSPRENPYPKPEFDIRDITG